MPHVPLALSDVLRQALKDTRNASRVIPYSEWVQRLGTLYTEDPTSSIQVLASDSEVSSTDVLMRERDADDDDNGNDEEPDANLASKMKRRVTCCDVAVGDSIPMESDDTACASASTVGDVAKASSALKVSTPSGGYTQ
eukprot:5590204-Amphidinium_carterae.1